MALVDGSVLNVLPADVLVHAGCDFVIGVDVGARFSDKFAGNSPDTATEEMQVPNIFETMVRAMSVQQRNMLAFGSQAADFTVEPDVTEIDPSDFQHAVNIAAIGKAAANAVVSEIQQRLRQLDISLVPQ